MPDLTNDSLLAGLFSSAGVTLATPQGAVGTTNQSWQSTAPSGSWDVIEQRYGARGVESGFTTTGLTALEWALPYQSGDGSFPGTNDAYHEVYFYVEALLRSTILLGYAHSHADYVAGVNALNWAQAHSGTGDANDAPYDHRNWSKAAALQEGGFATQAAVYANLALSLQLANGVDPELGGYDSSYQTAGLQFAEYYAVQLPLGSLRTNCLNSIKKGLDWELGRFNADGSAILTGNTRVFPGSGEVGPGGTEKSFDYRSAMEAFVAGYKLFGEISYYNLARQIGVHEGWN